MAEIFMLVPVKTRSFCYVQFLHLSKNLSRSKSNFTKVGVNFFITVTDTFKVDKKKGLELELD